MEYIYIYIYCILNKQRDERNLDSPDRPNTANDLRITAVPQNGSPSDQLQNNNYYFFYKKKHAYIFLCRISMRIRYAIVYHELLAVVNRKRKGK